jgi:hypothetical protein
MIALVPDGTEVDPLLARAHHDGRKAEVSIEVAKALRGERSWPPTAQSVRDLVWDDEVCELLRICWAGEHYPKSLGPALLTYVRYLKSSGHPECAIAFGEIAYDLAGDFVDPEILMELAMLYARQDRFAAARGMWKQVQLMGIRERREEWRLQALNGLGRVEHRQGNYGIAREAFESVAADSRIFPEIRAMALNNLGDTLTHVTPPLLEDAAVAFYEALYLHTDPTLRYSTLGNLGIVAKDLHYYAFADVCLRLVVSQSRCWDDVTNALIERLDLASLMEQPEEVVYIRTMLRFRIDKMSAAMQIDYRFRLGLMELRDGRSPAPDWNQGMSIAQREGLHGWAFKMENALNSPPAHQRPEPVEYPRLISAYLDINQQCAMVGA